MVSMYWSDDSLISEPRSAVVFVYGLRFTKLEAEDRDTADGDDNKGLAVRVDKDPIRLAFCLINSYQKPADFNRGFDRWVCM